MRMPRLFKIAMVTLLIGSIAAVDAHAGPILLSSYRSAGGSFDPQGLPIYLHQVFRSSNGTEDFDDGDAYGENLSGTIGLDGFYLGTQQSSFVPGDPGIGGAFTGFDLTSARAYSDVTQTSPSLSSFVFANSFATIEFTLDQATNWSWTASRVQSISSGVGVAGFSFYLYRLNDDDTYDFAAFEDLTGNFDQAIHYSGVLSAGNWTMLAGVGAQFNHTGIGSGNQRIELTEGEFRLTEVPVMSGVPEPSSTALLLSTVVVPLVARRLRTRRRN